MKRLLGFVVMALVLVPLLGFVKPAQATMPEAEAKAVVEVSCQAVQNTLDALQAANATGDVQQIDQALQALDLAMKNYAVASDNLARLQAGEAVSGAVLTNCLVVADKLNIYSAWLLKNNLAAARESFTEAQSQGATLPLPANPDAIPACLADLQSRIITVSAESVAILRNAGKTPGGDGGATRLGISIHVGSPI